MGSVATIRIRRDTSMKDAMRAYKVIVDGDTKGKVRRGKSVSVEVAPGHHEVHMKLDWTKSTAVELDVGPGEEVKLVCSPSKSALAHARVTDVTTGKDSYIVLERE